MLASFVSTFSFDRTLTNPPRLLTVSNLLLLILYFIADGIDGIHARATNRCSPLGYLLDHGVDSCVCLFLSTGLVSTLRLGMSWLSFLLMMNIFLVFYLGALQHKFTGVFVFNYISGCSEGIVLVLLIHVLSIFSEWPSFIANGKAIICSYHVSRRLLCTALALNLVYSLSEFFYVVLRELKTARYRQLMKSAFSIGMLFLLFVCSLGVRKHDDVLKSWAILFTFGCLFSVCYTEETLGIVSGAETDHRILAFAFFSMLVALLSCMLHSAYKLPLLTNIFATVVFFLLRTGSLIRSFCRRTNVKFVGFY